MSDSQCQCRRIARRSRRLSRGRASASSSPRRSAPCSNGTTSISTPLWRRSSRPLFFPPGNETAALLSAFAAYAAGFLVRPFGALVFGRLGDLVGRKYTFLVTILFMGVVDLRGRPAADLLGGRLAGAGADGRRCACIQGLALGGEYGGAATYVAEHAPRGNAAATPRAGSRPRRRSASSCRSPSSALCRTQMDAKAFADWGWRIPFLVSLILLVFSVYIRLKLERIRRSSPQMKAEGKGSKSPLTDSFLRYPNNRLRAAGPARRDRRPGRGVVHGPVLRPVLPHHHAEARLPVGLHADRHLAADRHAVLHLLRLAERQDRPPEDHHGGLPDRGRHLLPAVRGADALRQPRTSRPSRPRPRSRSRPIPAQCNFHIFVGPWSKFTECDRAKDALTKSGLSFTSVNGAGGIAGRRSRISDKKLDGLRRQGRRRPSSPPPSRRRAISADRRQGEGQLVHGRGDPGDHAHLRDHGLRTDRGLPGRAVPDQHPLHLDVAALSHRQRLVRRHAAPAGDRAGRLVGRHLLRALVPDRHGGHDAGDRHDLPAGNQGRGHHQGRSSARHGQERAGGPARAAGFILAALSSRAQRGTFRQQPLRTPP